MVSLLWFCQLPYPILLALLWSKTEGIRMKYLWGTLFALAVVFVVIGVIYMMREA
ncbi:hypothetical protein KCTCHS21_15860 [Cohnella abietis]|uniref:Uncharacterized protein n=1 Tax=Cohnella abietis TaxID=2507935 RepID=A0A3T1D247_9BACL|nr:hypothetical protein KCTCHS21_15860 [Cohnella abietis]